MQGLQDNGRIYRTPSGLLFVSDTFSSIDQSEIEKIIARARAGMPRSAFPEEMQALQSMQTTGGALGATVEKRLRDCLLWANLSQRLLVGLARRLEAEWKRGKEFLRKKSQH